MKKNALPLLPLLGDLQPADFYLEDEEIFDRKNFFEGNTSYQQCANLILRECKLEKVMIQKSVLERLECQNVVFDKCDFSNLECIAASFHRVHFKQCKLTGTNFSESFFKDCTFENCLADFASFSGANMKVVHFSDCQINESEFYELTWKNLLLTNNQIAGSNWFHTKMNGLDLRGNRFDKIAFSQDCLPGVLVDQEQALIIAAGLGMIIE